MPIEKTEARERAATLDDSAKLQLLGEIVERINLGHTLREVIDLVYDRLLAFLPYHRIAVAATDERREKLTIVAVRSDGPVIMEEGYSARIQGSSLVPLIREGRIRIINDLLQYLAHHPKSASTRLIVREGMRSSLTLPLLVRGIPVGVMFFSSRTPHAYRSEHEEYLRGVAGHVAIAVERSKLIDALRERTAFLENVLENSEDAIVVCDTEHKITSWNRGALRMFGYPPEEAMGHSLEILIPEDLRIENELGRIAATVARDGFIKDYETRRVTKDGRELSVNVTSTALRNPQGGMIGRSAILRDMTQIRALHEDLLRSQSLAAVGEMAATVAHEVKNPLAAVSGAIQVLRDTLPGNDSRRTIIAEILEQIRRLDRTVRDLLVFARPAVPVFIPVSVSESLRQAWSTISRQANGGLFRFAVTGSLDLVVPADPQLFQQVWINLFQNAVEAMPSGGQVDVRISRNGAARISVHDSGPGMDPAVAEKAFKPFFSTKTRGTGLGLPICRKIIEAHRGRLWIDRPSGGGATIHVEIPL